MTHREGLPGQRTAGDHATEQLMLFHRRQQEANGIRLLCKCTNLIITVDVIDFTLMLRQPLIQKFLQHRNSQLAPGFVKTDCTEFVTNDPLNFIATLGTNRCQIPEELFSIHTRDNPMDGCEHQTVVMDILQLHQRIPCRMTGQIHTGILSLQRLIAAFRRGKRVVTITHSQQNGATQIRVFLMDGSAEHRKPGIKILRRLTGENKLVDYVLNQTLLHMKPNTVAGAKSAIKVTNRMFDQAFDPAGLVCIALADDLGRISPHHQDTNEKFLRNRLAIFEEIMARPYVMGRDLVTAGLKPAEDFSEILAYAHKLRLAGIPKENALKQVLAFARQMRK